MTPDPTPDPSTPAALHFVLEVERFYAALIQFADSSLEWDAGVAPGLGGTLFYAGELNPQVRALLIAANIAGAASLAVTADSAAQKQAIRDGVADFLVNSVDEALRILKNEVRKREAVAVCIAADPQAVEREMLERGVLPDLLPPFVPPSASPFAFGQGVPRVEPSPAPASQSLVTWRVASAPVQWLPKLDALFIDYLHALPGPQASAGRNWLRLSPRYLGRLAQGIRVLHCAPDAAREFIARAQNAVDRGEIPVYVEIRLNDEEIFLFHPSPTLPANRHHSPGAQS
ncbi:MAG TPA: hypothetical protein VGG56_02640 [Terracidiphilus sp.]